MSTTEHIMHLPQLPYYLTVFKVVDTSKDLVSILVRSKVHVNKEVKLPTQYSIDYARTNPGNVEADALSAIVKRYDLKPEPFKYS
tara:strand:+ start:406 stop:660 length:255 start_codon:yes stop_codon:yes gene_type:complete